MISRVLLAVGTVVVGSAVGLAGAFVQAQRLVITLGETTLVIPWGTILAVLVLAMAIRGGVWAVRSRWGGWLLLAGWLAATLLLATETSSGDLAISSGGRQLVYLFAGVVIGAAVATVPLPRAYVAGSLPTGSPDASEYEPEGTSSLP